MLINDRITKYDCPGGDENERAIISELLNCYLNKNLFVSDDSVVCNGSSEAIEYVFTFAATKSYQGIFPLPGYFKYNFLANRKRVKINGYYSLSGEKTTQIKRGQEYLLVINSPEAITGHFYSFTFFKDLCNFIQPQHLFVLVDISYLLFDLQPKREVQRLLLQLFEYTQPENIVFVFFPF